MTEGMTVSRPLGPGDKPNMCILVYFVLIRTLSEHSRLNTYLPNWWSHTMYMQMYLSTQACLPWHLWLRLPPDWNSGVMHSFSRIPQISTKATVQIKQTYYKNYRYALFRSLQVTQISATYCLSGDTILVLIHYQGEGMGNFRGLTPP